MIEQYLLVHLPAPHLLSKNLSFHQEITYVQLLPSLTQGENMRILNTVKQSGLGICPM